VDFGIIADDNTGATDAAGMLTEKGVPTILLMDVPVEQDLKAVTAPFGAVVIGTGARSIDPKAAYARTAGAVKLLTKLGVQKIQIKYCSTFDSTPKGNIGPSIDAAMDCLKVPGTIVCPALPVNERTTYCGYHFVDGQLLSESPLRNHPLNPMTDSNLVRWLQMQTTRNVSLVGLTVIRQGVNALKADLFARTEQGQNYLVTDAIDQSDLRIIAHATAGWPLITGGSGITAEIPELLFKKRAPLSFSDRLASSGHATLVVAGSCSPATRKQNEFAMNHGFIGLRVNGRDVLNQKIDCGGLVQKAAHELDCGKDILLYSSTDSSDFERVQRKGTSMGLSASETGERIASILARICAGVIQLGRVGRFIISGGETSGAVCRRLKVWALEVGLPVAPGVPFCFPIDGPDIVMVLKSGNFGSEDFYTKVKQWK